MFPLIYYSIRMESTNYYVARVSYMIDTNDRNILLPTSFTWTTSKLRWIEQSSLWYLKKKMLNETSNILQIYTKQFFPLEKETNEKIIICRKVIRRIRNDILKKKNEWNLYFKFTRNNSFLWKKKQTRR